MEFILNIFAAVTAIIAAAFWFLSVHKKLPPLVSYWGSVPETDPFFMAVQYSARMNKWAAGFSSLSAFGVGAGLIVRYLAALG